MLYPKAKKDMAENALGVIRGKRGKWVLVGGAEHIKYGRHFRSGEVTFGNHLKEELGTEFVNICLVGTAEKGCCPEFDFCF